MIDDLQAEHNFINAVLETAGALVVVVDRAGRIVRLNRTAERITGYSSERVIDEHFWDLVLVPEEMKRAKQVFENLRAGQFPSEHENYWLTKDGERRLIAWSNTVLLDDESAVEYVIITGIDVTERRQAERQWRRVHDESRQRAKERTAELRHHVVFENLITRISTNFINSPPQKTDAGINRALRDVGQLMDVDRSYVFLFSIDKKRIDNTHEWCAEGIDPQIRRMQGVPVDALHWSNEILMRGEVLHIPRVADLPPEASAELEEFQGQGIQSLIAAPMLYQGETIGLLGFDAVRTEKKWSEGDIKLLKTLGAIFVNALEHKRSQAIQAGQQQFLELLAAGGGFSETLQALIHTIEEQWPGMLGLVLLLDEDGKHLHIGASVSLPEEYVQSIEGLKIGPMVGSCGTACYRRERVIVEDIAKDPRWDDLRDLALKYGLHACWSEPVFSSEKEVIGTFAMYYRHPRAPIEAELRTIEIGAHLVGVAVERKRTDEALQESRRMLSTLISNLPGMAYRRRDDADWTMEFVSQGSLELTGYRPEKLIGNQEISYRQLIHPADREPMQEEVRVALKERRHFEITYRLVTPEGVRWVWERGQGVTSPQGRLEAIEGFVTDITERVTARRNLEQRVEERTHELSTLLDVSHNVASTLELEPLLGLILEQLKPVVDYDAASVMVLEKDELRLLAYRGPIPQQEALQIRFDVEDAGVNRAVIERREPVLIPDVREGSELAAAFRETAGDELDTTYGYIRSWMGVPLIVKERLVGMLALDHSEPDYYTPHRAEMAKAFAAQAATAMENARLYEAEQDRLEESERRRRVAEGLRDVLAVLNTDRPLTEVLDTIVGQACRLLRAQAGAVYQLSRAEESVEIEATCHMPDGFLDIGSLPLIDTAPNRATLNREPFAVPDVQARLHNPAAEDLKTDPSVRSWAEIVGKHFRSYLSVPIVTRDDVYGAMSLFYEENREFSAEEIDLAMTLADQAALAIENARLRVQAEKSAAAAERSRLARDLHDAVTQTLFSSSLIADVLPRIWEKSPEQGMERLQELRELTRGALAEMRTLLLELRPSALTDAEMSELLRQLAESITGRARVPVDVSIEGNCSLPVDVKVALYRIAQESLNNVAKHAGATQASVQMHCGDDVTLEVVDDGLGFDVNSVPPDSLGLGIMQERAKEIDAELSVDSEVGEGTKIRVQWTAGV